MRGDLRNCWAEIKSDYKFLRGQDPILKNIISAYILNPGFKAVFLLRLQIFVYDLGWHRFSQLISNCNLRTTGAEFCIGLRVGSSLIIRHPSGIVVGGGVIIGNYCTILQGVTLGRVDLEINSSSEYPRLGSHVILSAHSAVLGNVTMVNETILGAHSILLNSALKKGTYVGIPAKLVKYLGFYE